MGTVLTSFHLQSTLLFVLSFESNGLSFKEKKRKTDFRDDSHHGFPLRMILAIFYLQVALILPIKFSQLAFWLRIRKAK